MTGFGFGPVWVGFSVGSFVGSVVGSFVGFVVGFSDFGGVYVAPGSPTVVPPEQAASVEASRPVRASLVRKERFRGYSLEVSFEPTWPERLMTASSPPR